MLKTVDWPGTRAGSLRHAVLIRAAVIGEPIQFPPRAQELLSEGTLEFLERGIGVGNGQHAFIR